MPNSQFTKPWHGVPREQILWNPSIVEDACIGCGTCDTGCSRLVYRFDFEHKKPRLVHEHYGILGELQHGILGELQRMMLPGTPLASRAEPATANQGPEILGNRGIP
jgi:ferredoxin